MMELYKEVMKELHPNNNNNNQLNNKYMKSLGLMLSVLRLKELEDKISKVVVMRRKKIVKVKRIRKQLIIRIDRE
ncbi:MAG: hypothetical protein EZS28_023574 [Streblomastix strix]|uniref:Uncharacterized protein n=1 Tax=Streblomastix strix TaxID=222440 RepID=A0A5J4VEM4_9EUKA|nr:MAG: hypothetical protein EZS28_023574 [Streblomastix strix]